MKTLILSETLLDHLKKRLQELQKKQAQVTNDLDECLEFYRRSIRPLKEKIAKTLQGQILFLYKQSKNRQKLEKKLEILPEFLCLTDTSNELRAIIEEIQGLDCTKMLDELLLEFNALTKQTSKKKVGLSELYKRLAKDFHPDLVFDEEEKKQKLEKMQELTSAYEAGDLSKMLLLSEDEEIPLDEETVQKQILDLEEKNPALDPKYTPIQKYVLSPFFQGLSTMKQAYDELDAEFMNLRKEEL